ncbi:MULTISPECIES: hypothetical protein [Bacillaceae]|uniref:hypothetical protein n=1 Tax=Bacillaceae TaxID=186817 RepID=UPI001E39C79D|nr:MULTISPECIES: hypothetical protein [Bacillaceae]MCE4047934.1 hypothetical protein [Bacillus sp. Au-Bac7]MCM3032466.1 hypothetical protein [Niallia sp. MER 6]MDL0436372.1 hypothetical protein [Niallia sp. SS-2023]UPO89229.1 hypothetical protein L8T27_008825 [Niallia sp. Man26]
MANNTLIISMIVNLFLQLIPIIIIGAIAWISLSRIAKRLEQKAEERLMLERENSARINQRLDELNQRLVVIEKMLKEVE